MVGAKILTPNISIMLGGIAIIIGIVTWGHKVIETIGSEITQLLPIMAFSVQLASAINVHVYTLFGIPVSTSHSIVGAIFGVGLVRGVRVVNIKILKEIIACWLATPFITGIITFIVLKTIMIFVKIG
jgi:PiT family inorganic phosphate transporter